jgi:hypothetical protein
VIFLDMKNMENKVIPMNDKYDVILKNNSDWFNIS